jgi:hypothetical protein
MSHHGEAHLYHRAYWHEGKMYYRGQVVIDKSVAVALSLMIFELSHLSFFVVYKLRQVRKQGVWIFFCNFRLL